jgi:hypothetical protein
MVKYGRTSLEDDQYRAALKKVTLFLKSNDRITNAILRGETGLNYDQAIKFFNRAIGDGVLERRGRASGTHYVLKGRKRG